MQHNASEDIPLVSVWMITYNHEKFIRQCIESVLNQKTNFSIEIIIGEDCSTDGTRRIVREFEDKYPKIIKPIYHEQNVGAIKNAYEYCLPKLKGKYVACLEGDDYWTDSEKLLKQITFLENNPDYSGCFTNASVVDSINNIEKPYLGFSGNRAYKIEDIIKGGGGLFPTASLVFRNDLKHIPEFYQNVKSGDRALSLLLAAKGDLYLINQRTCVYRKHGDGSYSSIIGNKEKLFEISMNNINLLERFNSLTGKIYTKAITRQISRLSKIALLNYSTSETLDTSKNFLLGKLTRIDRLSLAYYKIVKTLKSQ